MLHKSVQSIPALAKLNIIFHSRTFCKPASIETLFTYNLFGNSLAQVIVYITRTAMIIRNNERTSAKQTEC